MNLTVNILQTDFSSESALVVDLGNISINGDTNPGAASSHTAAVTDGESATITVEQSGFHNYEMIIDNVYMSDKTINIVLVPVVSDIENANYLRPWPSFYSFNDPCSFRVDFYNASSYSGDISWYINNVLYRESTKGQVCFNNPGDYQIKIRNTTSQLGELLWDVQFATIITGNTVSGDVNPIADYIILDTDTNTTVEEYRVDLSLDIQSPIEPFAEEDVSCYSRFTEVTIRPTWTLNRTGADSSQHTITWQVEDPEGIILEFNQTVFPLNLTQDFVAIPFTLSKLGTYTVTATIEDQECNNTFQTIISVETCNFVNLKNTECNVFDIENKSQDYEIDYFIKDVADDNVIVSEGTIEAENSLQVTFEETSLFTLTVTYTRDDEEITEIYLLNNYCSIEECFAKYIEDLLCPDNGRCEPCPPESDLKQMFLFYNTYFMKINTFFKKNSFFTALDQSRLNEITTLKQIMDRIEEFCGRRNCTDNAKGAFNSSFVSEGPYDFAGKGSNKNKVCNCTPRKTSSYYSDKKPSYCKTCGGSK